MKLKFDSSIKQRGNSMFIHLPAIVKNLMHLKSDTNIVVEIKNEREFIIHLPTTEDSSGNN